MNPESQKKAEQFFNNIQKGIKNTKNVEIIICPPFIYLAKLKSLTSKLKIGAQNCHYKEKGAYTGEISPSMLKNLKCEYVIIGHSERRNEFKETDEMINKKLLAIFKSKLKPILCVGEKQKEQMITAIKSQLKIGLKNINRAKAQDLIIAYEPIWAIGTGNFCDPNDVLEVNLFIKQTLSKIYNRKLAEEIPILYGGSVNANNADSYIKIGKMNGVLVGGSSLDSSEFINIIKKINKND